MINENFSNIKLTSARKSILDILINSSKPLSYEDIKDKISMDKQLFTEISQFLKKEIL